MNYFFTSDLHFFHEKILEYDKSPFKIIRDQHSAIVQNWNDVVGKEDVVYVLGDCFLPRKSEKQKLLTESEHLLNSLNGTLYLIKGNHEHYVMDNPSLLNRFDNVFDYKEVVIENQKICMFHYPVHEWNQAHRGSWMLHGHTHRSDDYDKKYKRLNVGIMNWNYTPLEFEFIKTKMNNKKNKNHK